MKTIFDDVDALTREKARADAAEAELAKHAGCIADNAKAFDESLGQCLRRAFAAESALAAARRECEARNRELYEKDEELSATRRALYAETEGLKKLRDALRKIDPIDVSVLDAATDKRQSVDWARVAKWMQETARIALAGGGDRP